MWSLPVSSMSASVWMCFFSEVIIGQTKSKLKKTHKCTTQKKSPAPGWVLADNQWLTCKKVVKQVEKIYITNSQIQARVNMNYMWVGSG